MRTVKELLELLYDHIDIYGLKNGLCTALYCLDVTQTEYNNLYDYIQFNRPSKYSSIFAFISRNSDYYWPRGFKRPRIKWLKKHIKKNT